MKNLRRFFSRCFWAFISLSLTAVVTLGIAIIVLELHLPSVETLKNVQLQVPLRIYSSDNQLLAMFGEKRRIPVTLEGVPQTLVHAIVATEDRRFFSHPGVDIYGLARAAVQLARTGRKSQGGSTITMQVARNFFLTRKKSYIRKLNEILLAIKIDQTISKKKTLELYLNKIYLGNRAYGVAAAAQVYYGKTLQQLSLAEIAMIAGLPKAPSALNPLANADAAKKRRHHVLTRMLEENYIDYAAYQAADASPLTASYHQPQTMIEAPYVAEAVRQMLIERFGEEAYTQGYQIHTTIDSRLQTAANQSVRNALFAYDRRHGYRAAQQNLGAIVTDDWPKQLAELPSKPDLIPAAITDVKNRNITALLTDGTEIQIDWAGIQWTKALSARQIVKIGDVIHVRKNKEEQWQLTQEPVIEGALVALDPTNGAIKAMTGGFDFGRSKFNRVMQAQRQAGSSFKPFIYSAALAHGYTLASLINDAPIVMNDSSLENLWRPQNDSRQFRGPTRLHEGLIHSRNLISIRLLKAIGIEFARTYAAQFGFELEQLPNTLSLALGSANVTPLQLATGFATFSNGGYKVEPYLIERISDATGKTILLANPAQACSDCDQPATQIITPQNAYLITQALRDVIQHGTGRAARQLGRHDLAGKTGTTNNKKDAWFIGFNQDIVTATWVGFDQPRTLKEYGSQAALPMWMDFMRVALEGVAEKELISPPGLVTVRIDPRTGLRARVGQEDSMFEIFREENAPKQQAPQYSAAKENTDDAAGIETTTTTDTGDLF